MGTQQGSPMNFQEKHHEASLVNGFIFKKALLSKTRELQLWLSTCLEVEKPGVSKKLIFFWKRHSYILPTKISISNSTEPPWGQRSLGGVGRVKAGGKKNQSRAVSSESCLSLFTCGLVTASQVSL